MKKEYEKLELELVLIENSDVIRTSPPVEDPSDPFEGGYNKDGWT